MSEQPERPEELTTVVTDDATTQTPAAGREEDHPTQAAEQPADPSTSWTGPAAGPDPAPSAPRRGPSVPTVIWGLAFALVAAGVIAVEVSDVDLNLDVTGPAALLVAGAVLVIWGIAGLGRGRARRS